MKLHHKTPLPFVLGLLVNIVLIIAMEILLFYRFPVPLEAKALARIDPRYENCTILDADDSYGNVDYILVETAQGHRDLIPVKGHPFFFNRVRIYKNKITQDVSVGDKVSHFFGIQKNTAEVAEDYVVNSSVGGYTNRQTILMYYMVLSGALTFLELALWEKIRNG